MASTYSTNLKLELMGTGDQSGTWGDTTNSNLGTLLEQAIVGYTTQAITDGADTVLTIANGATSVARNYVLQLTGTLTANRNLIVPAIQKPYIISNATVGGFSVTVKVSGQTGVTVANGKRALVYNNGTDIIEFANAPVTEAGTQTLTNKTLTSPTMTTPSLGAATATSINKVAVTAPATGSTLTIADGKTLTASNSITLAGTDGKTLTTSNSLTLAGTDGTVMTFPGTNASVVGAATAQTLTNKRIDPRVSSATSTTSPLAWNSDNFDVYAYTALANDLTLNADAGTPSNGNKMIFRIQADGTPRVLTFTGGTTNSFKPIGVTVTISGSNWTYTTSANKKTYIGCIYNAADSRWDIVAIAQEA